MLSKTLRCGNSAQDWKTRPSPRRRGGNALAGFPRRYTVPVIWLDQAGDEIEGGRFAAAGGAEQGEEFALLHVEGQVVEDDLSLKGLGDIFKSQDGIRRRTHGQQSDTCL